MSQVLEHNNSRVKQVNMNKRRGDGSTEKDQNKEEGKNLDSPCRLEVLSDEKWRDSEPDLAEHWIILHNWTF